MRDLFVPASWRWPHWLIVGFTAAYLAMYIGIMPPPQEVFSWLADRPEVAQAFAEPNFGRADALILVFSTLFLGPMAVVLATVAFVFLMAVFGGFVLPAVRWFRLPDWFATLLIIATVGAIGWTERAVWLPRSIWFLGLLARACRIVIA